MSRPLEVAVLCLAVTGLVAVAVTMLVREVTLLLGAVAVALGS